MTTLYTVQFTGFKKTPEIYKDFESLQGQKLA